MKLTWTLATLAGLGGIAAADTGTTDSAVLTIDEVRTSNRGVAENYLVMPSGGELSGQMTFLMANPVLGGMPLDFTDLALFGLRGRWAVLSSLEVSAGVDLLPKQPSYTHEKPWQSVNLGVRTPLGHTAALAVGGAGGHLLGHTGMWTHASLMVEWKKTIDEDFLSFDVQGGVDSTGLSAPGGPNALLGELAVQTSALFREPRGHWGAWLGIGYAVPVLKRGEDPTTALAIDPQPRLDFHIGTVLSLVKAWDLYVDGAVIDRGDLANPATRLPILDGGFDQKQIVFGVTRHLSAERHRGYDDQALQIGAR